VTGTFDQRQFIDDLRTFIGFETIICRNRREFERADEWIRAFFDPATTEFIDFECHGLTSRIIKPRDSQRPNVLGDGHIEVVPARQEDFHLREEEGVLYGRGVADMKTQCLAMMYVLRELIRDGEHNDYWLLFSEDEEYGSAAGVAIVVEWLCDEDLFPDVVFAPDGDPDFAYVEKEKGMVSFSATVRGRAAHGSRPWLGDNAIDKAFAFYEALRKLYPNPCAESEWTNSLSMTTISGGDAHNQIPHRCRAGFDLRITEEHDPAEIAATLAEVAKRFDAELKFSHKDPAVYYPKEAPVARRHLTILREVSGEEPEILHSAGASNGRLYAAKRPDVHVLMSSPRIGGSHAEGECVEVDSLAPFHELVRRTALLGTRKRSGE
jgi:succinyl-diaminopimelate desuccinylase